MTLAAGTRLGPYEILSLLGAGGMGEVYRARDTRLKRDVAIKVLPASFSADHDRLRRFEQEAQAAGALNHPNITAVYDIGTHEGAPYVVQELLEGETLRAALAGGKFSWRRAIDYSLQIANGLAAAHEKGIVHRDLKPENLFVTKDGRVKILDFGLAKLIQRDVPPEEETSAPTATPGTEPGIVMGTVGYMSPEQVRGRPADLHSDIFSFGCVLYEMLTGARAFKGDSAVETMNAILKEEPHDLSAAATGIPPALDRIVRHCLEKSPAERFQSARDLAFDLQSLSEASTPSATAHVAASRSRAIRRRVLLGAAMTAALALAFVSGRRTAPEGVSPGEVSFRRLTFRRGNLLRARFAPDGKTVVYSAAWDGKPAELFSVRTDSIESRPLGIPNADILSVSSKGELAILIKKGYLSTGGRGTLARVPLGGGAPREITEDVFSAGWSPDGSELAVVPERAGGKSRLEYPIGKTLYETTGHLACASVSPKGDFVSLIEFERSVGRNFVVVADRGGKVRRLSGPWDSIDCPVWRPDGRSVVFDAGSQLTNSAIREVSLAGRERILYPPGELLTLHDLLPDGRLLVERKLSREGIAMRPPGEERERDMSWLDGSWRPILSADGSTLVFTETAEGGGPARGVFLRKVGAESAIRLGDGIACSLSPDEKWVLSLLPGPPPELVLLPTGAGAARKIALPGLTIVWGFILPDGKTLFVRASEPGKPVGIWILPLEEGKPRLVLPEVSEQYRAASSPDGKRLAFHMGGGKGFILSLEGGERIPLRGLEAEDGIAQWSEDGRYLFAYRPSELPGKIFRIEIETGRRELWKELMPADPVGVVQAISWVAITSDGRSYAYSYKRVIASDLYVLEGLK